jgi:UDP-glucose 4-epimerase
MVTEYLTYCVEACSRQKAKPRLVLISSAKVYGHVLHVPISEHITAKPEDESAAQLTSWEFHTIQTMRQFGIRGAVARLFEVYGPGITSGTAYQLAELSDSRRRSPQHVEFVKDDERDWIHAVDAAAAVARIATTCPIDEDPDDQPHIVNVATGRSITLGTAARRLLPRTAKIKTLLKRESQQQPARRQRACIARLRRLGFQPAIPFEKGAKLFARWMRESPAQPKKRRLTTDYEHQTAYDKSPPPCIPEPGQPVAAGSPA